MTKQDLMDILIIGIKEADARMDRNVTISKGAASEILSFLIRTQEAEEPRVDEQGQVLFYCADCGRSFWAAPREDPECFEKWHYHRWYANCPQCKAETMQNDRYWR